jgi:hypothetical protein
VKAARSVRRGLFVETNHDPARSSLVLGSGRSGTTWVAEAIAFQCRARVLFEPFQFQGDSDVPLFPSHDGEPTLAAFAEKVLTGRFRNASANRVTSIPFPKARVIKDIHATNLLPWFREKYPAVPVVYLIRHPIATSLSRLKAGEFLGLSAYLATPAGRAEAEGSPAAAWLEAYDRFRSDPDPLIQRVAEWAMENAYAVDYCRRSSDPRTFFVKYEDLVAEPVDRLVDLAERCRPTEMRTRARELTSKRATKPSLTDWFGSASAPTVNGHVDLDRWRRDVSPAQYGRSTDVLSAFDLDHLYGDDSASPGLHA